MYVNDIKLYKTWILSKDLQDTQADETTAIASSIPRLDLVSLFVQCFYPILALLDWLSTVRRQTTYQHNLLWEALDATIDIWYTIRVIQYAAVQRQSWQATFETWEMVACAVVSTVKHIYTLGYFPRQRVSISLVKLPTPVLELVCSQGRSSKSTLDSSISYSYHTSASESGEPG